MRLSERIMSVKPSPTLAMQAKANALKAAGEVVFPLAAGEPDFPTPEPIRRACVRALDEGHTGYTASAGIPALRAAIRRLYRERHNLAFEDNQVVVCCGAKQALLNAFLSLLDPGSEAIIQAPYWVSYPEQIRLCGATPVLLPPAKGGSQINLPALAMAITSRTRVIVLNSPCNPTGQVASEDELRQVAKLAIERDLVVVSDDIYDRLLFDGRKFVSVAQLVPELAARCVLVNGVSKSYSMTGWRLGYAVGPADLIAAMRKVQDQSTSNATTFVQHAVVTALQSPPEIVEEMVRAFEQRRNRMVELLRALPGVECPMPAGTFYAFPSFAGVLGKSFMGERIETTQRLSELLLEQEHVATVAGEAFGAPGHIRFSFATNIDVIEAGLERVGHFLREMR